MNTKNWNSYPLSNTDYFVDRTLLQLFKEKTLFLVYLINKRGINPTNKSFIASHKEIKNETGLSEYQIKKYKKFFKEHNIIEIKKKGMPAKEHYKLHLNQINNYIKNKGGE
jgi:hypothetical protein